MKAIKSAIKTMASIYDYPEEQLEEWKDIIMEYINSGTTYLAEIYEDDYTFSDMDWFDFTDIVDELISDGKIITDRYITVTRL